MLSFRLPSPPTSTQISTAPAAKGVGGDIRVTSSAELRAHAAATPAGTSRSLPSLERAPPMPSPSPPLSPPTLAPSPPLASPPRTWPPKNPTSLSPGPPNGIPPPLLSPRMRRPPPPLAQPLPVPGPVRPPSGLLQLAGTQGLSVPDLEPLARRLSAVFRGLAAGRLLAPGHGSGLRHQGPPGHDRVPHASIQARPACQDSNAMMGQQSPQEQDRNQDCPSVEQEDYQHVERDYYQNVEKGEYQNIEPHQNIEQVSKHERRLHGQI